MTPSDPPLPNRPAPPENPAVGYTLTDEHGTVLAEHEGTREFYAASTIKVAVLLTTLRAVEAGRASLTDPLVATRTFTGADGAPFTLVGDHTDPELPAPGSPLTLREALAAMMARSSNEATNLVLGQVGLPAVARTVTDAGATSTRVDRLIGDPVAVARGLALRTSPADLARLLRLTTAPGLLTEQHHLAAELMTHPRLAPIGAAVAPGVPWLSKSGEVEGYRHDVARIGAPGSPGCRYLAVCTQGVSRAAGDAVVAALTRALVPQHCGG
ncbi:serine hydrolase [Kytococcus sedentarius]|uniref:serine hydrolase n=1 Tax=Kytococcus sedentarius TaxID=1276 RepID=UPI0035BBABF8